jgi:hypothetical protein
VSVPARATGPRPPPGGGEAEPPTHTEEAAQVPTHYKY